MMIVVCSTDNQVLRVEWPENYEGRTVVSHGLHEECADRILADLQSAAFRRIVGGK